MARRFFSVTKSGVATGTALKTVLQVKAVNVTLALLEASISFDGVSTTGQPILVQLTQQSTAGTMSALTPVLLDQGIVYTINATAQHTATVEPTAVAVLRNWLVHPQAGIVIPLPLQGDVVVDVTKYLGLVVTAPAGVNCAPYLKFEE